MAAFLHENMLEFIAEDGIQCAAEERLQATLAAYRGGKATLAEVLLARRNDIDVHLQALQLQMETARLWAQLSFLFPDDGSAAHSAMSMNKEVK